MPTTEALADAENVLRIIYVAAYQLDVGDTLVGPRWGTLMPWAKLHQREGVHYVEVDTPMRVFYNDIDAAAAKDAVSLLGYQSYASMRQPLTKTAWATIPSTYVVCEEDNAIPVAVQERMAQRADEVHRLSTSHSPFLSQPAALARLIRDSVAAA
jgi:pimeloyl-ACP methyl ester carboxylesterase